jgi:hypothetical protein
MAASQAAVRRPAVRRHCHVKKKKLPEDFVSSIFDICDGAGSGSANRNKLQQTASRKINVPPALLLYSSDVSSSNKTRQFGELAPLTPARLAAETLQRRECAYNGSLLCFLRCGRSCHACRAAEKSCTVGQVHGNSRVDKGLTGSERLNTVLGLAHRYGDAHAAAQLPNAQTMAAVMLCSVWRLRRRSRQGRRHSKCKQEATSMASKDVQCEALGQDFCRLVRAGAEACAAISFPAPPPHWRRKI